MEALSSAVAQEGVSRVSSLITSKLADDDVASREIMLEMAVSKLELAIERSGKLPITDVSLLQQRQKIKGAYTEGKELLRMHKQQQQRLEDREEVGQVVTASSFLGRFTHAANRFILSPLGFNKGHLSSSAVKKFEKYAELADKFLQDVYSGITHRPFMLSNNSLVRRLFEWRTLVCATKKGTFQQRLFVIWTTRSEERGVEAYLVYLYNDPKMPEKSFRLMLGLRLSESTDIVGTAIRCLQPLVSQFMPAAEFAIGEVSQQVTASNLLELSPSREHELVPHKKHYANLSHTYRLDPFCCQPNEHGSSANNTVSSQLSHICPEEVILVEFDSNVLIEKRYSSRRLSDEADRSFMLPLTFEYGFNVPTKKTLILFSTSSDEAGRSVTLPLTLEVTFMPHLDRQLDDKCDHSNRSISIQEVLDAVGSTAINGFIVNDVDGAAVTWTSKHGAAKFRMKKRTTRRRTKRKR